MEWEQSSFQSSGQGREWLALDLKQQNQEHCDISSPTQGLKMNNTGNQLQHATAKSCLTPLAQEQLESHQEAETRTFIKKELTAAYSKSFQKNVNCLNCGRIHCPKALSAIFSLNE